MKFSSYKTLASNFVILYEDKIWDKLTSEKIKEILDIGSKSEEPVDILENSDLNIRVLTLKDRNKRITVEFNRVVVDQLVDFETLDKGFTEKIIALLGETKPQAIGFNIEVAIDLEEKIGWQQFFSSRVRDFIGKKEVKNFGFKFQISEEEDRSFIMNIATAVKDDGNLYMRLNSHHENIKILSQDIIVSGWDKSLNLLKSILADI